MGDGGGPIVGARDGQGENAHVGEVDGCFVDDLEGHSVCARNVLGACAKVR